MMPDRAPQRIGWPSKRAAISDAWVKDVRTAVDLVLQRHYEQGIQLASKGYLAAIRAVLVPQWRRELAEEKRPWYYAMAQDGFDLAALEFADREAGKQIGPPAPEIDPELMPRRLREATDEWIEQTTGFETETTYRQFAEEYARLKSDPSALTPDVIARRMGEKFDDFSLVRAKRIVRTSTIHTYNGGAKEQYIQRGVRRLEWFVTEDDLTCEYCIPLDGKTVGTEENFAAEGDTLEGLQGGSLDIAWDVGHPPIHANCRCALLPVLDSIV